jgi:large subunit ribosomal protein L21
LKHSNVFRESDGGLNRHDCGLTFSLISPRGEVVVFLHTVSIGAYHMQAIIEVAGKQYRVQPSERHVVPKLPVEVGNTIEFRTVLATIEGDSIRVGTPYRNAIVTATVRAHGKADKVLVFKKKRRKGYKKLRGHRQQYTEIEITGITVND